MPYVYILKEKHVIGEKNIRFRLSDVVDNEESARKFMSQDSQNQVIDPNYNQIIELFIPQDEYKKWLAQLGNYDNIITYMKVQEFLGLNNKYKSQNR